MQILIINLFHFKQNATYRLYIDENNRDEDTNKYILLQTIVRIDAAHEIVREQNQWVQGTAPHNGNAACAAHAHRGTAAAATGIAQHAMP